MVILGYIFAASLAIVWVLVTIWALFWDRPRGRRRCPKCFYEIDTALGLKCAECGHAASSERSLMRTRRRWGAAVLALVLLLAPAVVAVGLARFGQEGWGSVPASVATRLLWMESRSLREDIVRRIAEGEIEHDEAARIVRFAARQLERGPKGAVDALELLDAIARNSFVLTNGPPNTPGPMLDELHPELTVPQLVSIVESGPGVDAARAAGLLAHLRDVDERANMTLLVSLASEDPAVASAALHAIRRQLRTNPTVRRLPHPPTGTHRHRTVSAGRVHEQALRAFSGRVRELQANERALMAWLGEMIHSEGAVSGIAVGTEPLWRDMAMWLYCRLRRYDDEAWDAVLAIMEDGDPAMRLVAVEQLSGFQWSQRVEAALRRAIHDSDGRTNHAAILTAAQFGQDASPLVPDFLAFVRAPERMGGTTGLVNQYRAIGGDERDLLPVIIDYLEALADSEGQPGRENVPERTVHITKRSAFGEARWLTDLGLRDERGAEVVRRLMHTKPPIFDAASLATAYAVLSGDVTGGTRFVLDLEPDLTVSLLIGSPQQTVLELLRRRLADPDLIMEYFVETEDVSRRRGLADVMDRFLSPDMLAEYEVILKRLADDPDDAVAAAGRSALGKIQR